MNENEMRLTREKLDFYINNKEMVHIELINKRFLNARIIEKVNDNIYLISDRVIGLMHLFVLEVKSISVFVEGKNGRNPGNS